MNNIQMNEIKYCTHCGSANKKSAVICCECDRKIRNTYRPFYDFLKKHTKDDITGTVTDTLFSCLKEFLMSHVYGVALSVTIVATAVSAVYSAEPHIEKTTEAKTISVTGQQVIEEEEEETIPLNADDLDNFEHIATNYDAFVDMLRPSESYWDTSGSEYSSASQLYAENNISGFAYGGIHEMISNPIPMYMLDEDPNYNDDELEYNKFSSDRYLDTSSAVSGENCTTQIAKTLHNDGYRVAECNYVLCENAGEYDFDTHTGTGFAKKLVYRIVYVEHEGKWYIADDRLVSRENI